MISNELSKEEYVRIYNDEFNIFEQTDYTNDLVIGGDDLYLMINLYEPVLGPEIKIKPLEVPKDNMFYNLNGMDNRIKYSVREGYDDVYSIDSDFLRMDNGFKIMAFFENNLYMGSVWFKYVDEFIAIYGIKSSIQSTILGIKGNSKNFLIYLN